VAATVGYNYGEDALDCCMSYLEGGGDHYLRCVRPQEPPADRDRLHQREDRQDRRMFKNVDVDLNMYFTSAIVTQNQERHSLRGRHPDYLVFD